MSAELRSCSTRREMARPCAGSSSTGSRSRCTSQVAGETTGACRFDLSRAFSQLRWDEGKTNLLVDGRFVLQGEVAGLASPGETGRGEAQALFAGHPLQLRGMGGRPGGKEQPGRPGARGSDVHLEREPVDEDS